MRLQELVAGPMGDRMLSQLESSEWVLDGSASAPRVIYTFSDPNCPFCNRLWQAARPWVDAGKVQLRHVMVGVIREDSAGKVATILGADDPSAMLTQNERRFAQGGVSAAPNVPAGVRRALESNQMLMMELGFRGTPALVFCDADGTVQRRGGMLQGDDLNVVMGPLTVAARRPRGAGVQGRLISLFPRHPDVGRYRPANRGARIIGNPPAPSDFDLTAMQAHAGEAAKLLKALANERRLQVLCLLAGGERSVGELNEMLELSQSALSQHLAVLREEGLVQTRREAQMIYYLLAPGPAGEVMATLYGIYCGP